MYAADEFFNFGNILKLFSVYTCIRQSLVYEASDHTVLIYRASKALVFFPLLKLMRYPPIDFYKGRQVLYLRLSL